MFSPGSLAKPSSDRTRSLGLETWREAESLVRLRWRTFLEADEGHRQWAFASYAAALDHEEAAAAELASLTPSAIAA
jgi:hypothetical protein